MTTYQEKALPTKLYVGIDLGTTFTGVAYACPPYKQISTIRQWPGSDTDELKVPTRLFYDDHETLLGWGFAHPVDENPYEERGLQGANVVEKFKLDIDPSLDFQSGSTSEKRTTSSQISRWYKDFLRCLYEHVKDVLEKSYPEAWSQEVEFTFSVPNLYGPHIISRFREFISDTGFGGGQHQVSLVSLTESQAAIVYASDNLAFKNNDLVLVCDAGGGTTDCSLLSIEHQEGCRLQIHEVSPAFGMRIGSTDIDSAIKTLYLSRICEQAWGKHVPWPDQSIDRAIEEYKVSFTTTTTLHLTLRSIRGFPEVRISSQEVRSIFDTIVVRIFDSVDAELRSIWLAGLLKGDDTYVVLCGGLGSSQYIRARLTESFLNPEISGMPRACIIDMQEPQLVVAKGLVAERMRAAGAIWPSTSSRQDLARNGKASQKPGEGLSFSRKSARSLSLDDSRYQAEPLALCMTYNATDEDHKHEPEEIDLSQQQLTALDPSPQVSLTSYVQDSSDSLVWQFSEQTDLSAPPVLRCSSADSIPPPYLLEDTCSPAGSASSQQIPQVLHGQSSRSPQASRRRRRRTRASQCDEALLDQLRAPPGSIFGSRKCRWSYGILKLELYDESKHLRQDVWRFPLNNKLYVENIIEWVIKQGEEINDEWTARFLCQKMLSSSQADNKRYIFQTHLVTSDRKPHQLPKSMTQGGAQALCNIEADLSQFPLSEFEKHVHKLGLFKKNRIFYLVKYHVAASSTPADIIFEVLFKSKSADHRVERRVSWHDVTQAAPPTLTPDVGSLPAVQQSTTAV